MAAKVDRICKHCGKTFAVPAHVIKHGRGQTCSRQCQYLSIRRRVSIACAQCGKQFEVQRGHYEFRARTCGVPTYCSRECAHASPEWKRNLGESLRNSPTAQAAQRRAVAALNSESSEERRRRSERVKAAWRNPETRARIQAGITARSQNPLWFSAPHFRRGDQHPKFRGNKRGRETLTSRYEYKRWRKAIYERDDYTCQHCMKRGGRLNAHHINPWSSHPDLRFEVGNGITLCVDCHRAIPRPK